MPGCRYRFYRQNTRGSCVIRKPNSAELTDSLCSLVSHFPQRSLFAPSFLHFSDPLPVLTVRFFNVAFVLEEVLLGQCTAS